MPNLPKTALIRAAACPGAGKRLKLRQRVPSNRPVGHNDLRASQDGEVPGRGAGAEDRVLNAVLAQGKTRSSKAVALELAADQTLSNWSGPATHPRWSLRNSVMASPTRSDARRATTTTAPPARLATRSIST